MNKLYITVLNSCVDDSKLKGLDRSQIVEKMRVRYQELASKIKKDYPEISIYDVSMLFLILEMSEETYNRVNAEIEERFNCMVIISDLPLHLI